MSIEVTSEDIKEVSRLLGVNYPCDWVTIPADEIIRCAFLVMSRKTGLLAAVDDACAKLPEDYEIRIWVNRDSAGVECFDPDGDKLHPVEYDDLEWEVRAALEAAIEDANQ